jgi:hypothetical protein
MYALSRRMLACWIKCSTVMRSCVPNNVLRHHLGVIYYPDRQKGLEDVEQPNKTKAGEDDITNDY